MTPKHLGIVGHAGLKKHKEIFHISAKDSGLGARARLGVRSLGIQMWLSGFSLKFRNEDVRPRAEQKDCS